MSITRIMSIMLLMLRRNVELPTLSSTRQPNSSSHTKRARCFSIRANTEHFLYMWCDGMANLKSYLNCSLLASSSYYQTKVKKLHHNTTPPTPAIASPPQILNLTSTEFLFACLLLLSSTQATASRPRSPLPQVTTVRRATTAPPAPAALRTPNQTSP